MKKSELYVEALNAVNVEVKKEALVEIQLRLAEVQRIRESLDLAEKDLKRLLNEDVSLLKE